MCCCECEACEGAGIWRVKVLRRYRGNFGKWLGPYCTPCLEEDLEGFHTGGGPTDLVMEKIVRVRAARKLPAYTTEERK